MPCRPPTNTLFKSPKKISDQVRSMLSEDAALALLKCYCGPLREVSWVYADFHRCKVWTDAAREHVDFVLQPASAETVTVSRNNGVGARLALSVAQAVSCCRGFDPAAQGAPFWRRVAPTLWSHCPPSGRLALSRATFAHVGLSLNSNSPADDAFWVGFFHGTPASGAVLTTVLNGLRPHLEIAEPLPPVRAALARSTTYETTFDRTQPPTFSLMVGRGPTVPPHTLNVLLRTALARPPVSWTARTHVGLVVDYQVDDDPSITRKNLQLLVSARTALEPPVSLTIDRLLIELEPHHPPRSAGPGEATALALVTRGRALGVFLRTLLHSARDTLRVNTVALLACSRTDFRHVGAAMSAVALASHPIAALRCSELFYATRPQHQPQRLAWLAYTLYCRRRWNQPLLSLSLLSSDAAMNEEETEYITQLLVHGKPLRDVVGEALRLRLDGDDDQVARLHVKCLRLGSTIRLTRGMRLFFEPFCVDAGGEAVMVEGEAEELDLVAHVADHGGVFGVVYAGYGLVWAPAASAIVCHRLKEEDGDVSMVESSFDSSPSPLGAALASLALRFEGALEVVPPAWIPSALRISGMLPLLASETLKELTVGRAVVTREDLALVVDIPPRLQKLTLDRCAIETLAPLVGSYQRGSTRIAVLSLSWALSTFAFATS